MVVWMTIYRTCQWCSAFFIIFQKSDSDNKYFLLHLRSRIIEFLGGEFSLFLRKKRKIINIIIICKSVGIKVIVVPNWVCLYCGRVCKMTIYRTCHCYSVFINFQKKGESEKKFALLVDLLGCEKIHLFLKLFWRELKRKKNCVFFNVKFIYFSPELFFVTFWQDHKLLLLFFLN
jgi:hypothetical protein